MLFEEKIKETNFRPTKNITQVRLDIEPKRENNLQKINFKIRAIRHIMKTRGKIIWQT